MVIVFRLKSSTVYSFADGYRMRKEFETEGEAVSWHKVEGNASTGVMMYGSPYANSIINYFIYLLVRDVLRCYRYQ